MWDELSDAELLARLVQRGVNEELARDIVANRDKEHEVITKWLD